MCCPLVVRWLVPVSLCACVLFGFGVVVVVCWLSVVALFAGWCSMVAVAVARCCLLRCGDGRCPFVLIVVGSCCLLMLVDVSTRGRPVCSCCSAVRDVRLLPLFLSCVGPNVCGEPVCLVWLCVFVLCVCVPGCWPCAN